MAILILSFQIFDFLIFLGFSKGPDWNAQINLVILKCQLPDNEAKNMTGKI